MWIPNATCVITRVTGTNVYGEEALAPTRVTEQCAVVRMRHKVGSSTVRADSSASRGHADEHSTDFIILVGPKTTARMGDQLEILGVKIRVNEIQPRLNMAREIEHYEVRGEFWA